MKSTKDGNSKKNTTTSSYKARTNKTSTSKRYSTERKSSSNNKSVNERTRTKQKSEHDFFTEDKKNVSRQSFRNDKSKEDGRKTRRTNSDTTERKRNYSSTAHSRPSFRDKSDRESFKSRRKVNTFEEDGRKTRRTNSDTTERERNYSSTARSRPSFRDKSDRDSFKSRRKVNTFEEDGRKTRRTNSDTTERKRNYSSTTHSRPSFRDKSDRESFKNKRKVNTFDNNRRRGRYTFHSETDPQEQKYYRRNNDQDTFSHKKNFRREDDEREIGHDPQRKRVSTVLDSEIMREIVQKRRATGRISHKPKVLSLSWSEERGPIRLNKYIANSGICSRREADSLIIAGAITVNGQVVTELGTKVMPVDEVRYEDKILQREKPVYILLNKPKGYITTTDDEKDRDDVMMLIEGACTQRVYPVGRLDRDTTGLLLFTNDGEMTKKLTHPRHEIKKIYQVELDKDMLLADFESLANGIELSDGFMKPDDLAFVDGQKNVLGIVLHSGRNRIVRRLFFHLGYEIEKLDRVYYAGLTKKDLPRGHWRFLRQEEINILKRSL
ncbi:MAG: pseudouridine synthase [Bacteroidales bacterium]|jgi:23S rRNA pseudouridine2605 synthase|nr:pseudouridine synthase [Bacteroidales bacterium]